MHRRTRLTISIVVIVLLLLAGAVYLRKKAPPEAARLLPESDGILYADLRPLRTAMHFDQHPVRHDPEYQHFIDATGIEVERDLDEVAFALHRMDNPHGPNGPVAFSEVFAGHFDGRRLAQYLSGAAASTETYAGHTIYSIPNDGRTVRVTLLGYDMVAASNTPSPEQIHSILDRYRTAALPFTGSSLLATHYPDVPLLSLAWGLGQIGLPLSEEGSDMKVMGLSLPVTPQATFIASLGWAGKTRLRIEEIAPDEASAKEATGSLSTLLNFAHMATSNTSTQDSNDQELQALLNSTTVEQHKNRAILTATVPNALLQRLVSNSQQPATAPASPDQNSDQTPGQNSGQK